MKKLILLAAVTLVGAHTASVCAVDRFHSVPERSRSRPDLRHPRSVQLQHALASPEQQAQRRATASEPSLETPEPLAVGAERTSGERGDTGEE